MQWRQTPALAWLTAAPLGWSPRPGCSGNTSPTWLTSSVNDIRRGPVEVGCALDIGLTQVLRQCQVVTGKVAIIFRSFFIAGNLLTHVKCVYSTRRLCAIWQCSEMQMVMRVPPQKKTFDRENLKFGLKFSILVPHFGASGGILTTRHVMNFGPQTKTL